MTLKEFKNSYLITDAELLTLQVDYATDNNTNSNIITIQLKGRRVLSKNKIDEVIFSLRFSEMVGFNYNDSFDSKTISQSTLVKTNSGQFYLPLDPFHEDQPSEEDNMIIQSKKLFIIDHNNVKHQII